jgi:hypothetical protein
MTSRPMTGGRFPVRNSTFIRTLFFHIANRYHGRTPCQVALLPPFDSVSHGVFTGFRATEGLCQLPRVVDANIIFN